MSLGSLASVIFQVEREKYMPIYEYQCPECGVFEVIQKFSDKALELCPRCKEQGKENAVQKALSAAAFHLKGGGWYKTDYASSSSSAGGSTSSGSSSSGSSSSASSSNSDASSSDATPKKACGTGCGCH